MDNWTKVIKRLKVVGNSTVLQELLRAGGIFLLLAAVITGIVVAAATYGSYWGVEKEAVHPEVAGVTVSAVKNGMVDEYYETSGEIHAIQIGVISAKSAGKITVIDAKIGDSVTAGQLLITLDDEDFKQRLQSIRVALMSAQEELEAARQRLGRSNASYQRVKGLYNIQAISRKDNEKVEFQHQDDLDAVDMAQNRVDRILAAKMVAETQAANSRITAPFAGVVTERKVEAGNNILPDTLLMKVEDTSAFIAECLIDQQLAGKVSSGQKAVVLVEELQLEITIPITEVAPSPTSPGMYVVRAQLNGVGLKSGMSAKMKIPASQRGALLAPASAVVNYRGQAGVYVLKPDLIMVFRPVQFGGRYDQQIEILGGVTAGEEVVVEGLDKAADGGRAKDARSQ